MPEELFSPKEAAAYLDISEITMYRRMKEKGLKPANYNPMRKRQKEPKYTKTQLDELKEDCRNAA